MAKRFTDTEKWKKPFIKNLKCCYKLLWLYICDDCDHAGVWQVDFDVARIRIGENVNENDALIAFGDKVQPFDNGNKWFISSFIEFQYPSGLNENNRAHIAILNLTKKYNLSLVSDLTKKYNTSPLKAPLEGAKDKDKEIDIEYLEEIEISKGVEFIKIITGILLTEKEVSDYWKAFLLHNTKSHPTKRERIEHFRNWLKGQVFTNRKVSQTKKLVE